MECRTTSISGSPKNKKMKLNKMKTLYEENNHC
jgi:hypothetical protein